MNQLQKNVRQLRKFRKRFGGELNDGHILKIFGVKPREVKKESRRRAEMIWERKLHKAQNYAKRLRFLNWVKYIAVSGSVAAEVAKDEDDIDLYVVVKNDRMWLYRGLMMLNPAIWGITRRYHTKNDKDQICLNMITEERGLEFEHDIFNFHELYFMKPVYKPEYKEYILARNRWVTEYGGKLSDLDTGDVKISRRNYFYAIIEFFAFYFQYFFMSLTKHNPEYERLKRNNRRGRIEFFKSEFKEKIIKS